MEQLHECWEVLYQGETSASCVLSKVLDGPLNIHTISFRRPPTKVCFQSPVASNSEDLVLLLSLVAEALSRLPQSWRVFVL